MGKVTEIIEQTAKEDSGRLPALWDAAYDELKILARSRLRRDGPMTLLDTTSLVNESYLKLSAGGKAQVNAATRKEFFAYASRVMRSVIVDLARERAAEIHGGNVQRVTLNTDAAGAQPEDDPLRMHEALESLEKLEPRLAQVVQMRYFGGLTEAEVAEALGIAERTVRRDWDKARALLRTMLAD